MAYSKLTGIELINFMCFEHESFYFDDTGIINLKGYNDFGKSTVLRALAVIFADEYKRLQVKFIRYGEEYFRIIVTFDDGVTVIRDKYLNGQSLYEMYKGEKLIFTTKEGRKLGKVDDVPEPVKKYFGMCDSNTGIINYQSRETKLLLTDTTGSENYQELHHVLRSVEISRASQLINADKNKLGQEMVRIEADLQSTELQLAACEKISEELLTKLTERESIARNNEVMLSSIKDIKETSDTLSKLVVPPKVERVDSAKLRSISGILNALKDVENLVVVPRIPKIDTSKYRSLLNLLAVSEDYERYVKSMLPVVNYIDTKQISLLSEIQEVLSDYERCVCSMIPSIPKVDTSNLDMISSVKGVCEDYSSMIERYNNVLNELDSVREELRVLTEEAKEKGYSFATCPNCGTFVEVKL